MPKGHELTMFQKGEIIALEPHFSHADIGDQLGIPRETITDFLERSQTRQSIENLPRPGRPRKTSDTADRWLVRNAESETRVPFRQLQSELNIDISKRTIQRRLREAGIRKWRAVQRALLTKSDAKKRREWAKKYQHWTSEDWRKVIWSDETILKRDSDSNIVWVFRRQTEAEKYAQKNIHGKRKQDSISLMIWACFIGDKLGPLVFIDGTVNKETYIGMLEEHFVPFLEALYDDDPAARHFQQDNATPHTAKKTQSFLDSLATKYGLTIMHWPPNSPDMNPIEHIWAHIKRELHRRFPDTASLSGAAETIRVTLRQRVLEVWWDIGRDLLDSLVESMPRRVAALLHAHGWYTEF